MFLGAAVAARPNGSRTAGAEPGDRITLAVRGTDSAVALDATRCDVAVALNAERAVAAIEQRTTRALATARLAK